MKYETADAQLAAHLKRQNEIIESGKEDQKQAKKERAELAHVLGLLRAHTHPLDVLRIEAAVIADSLVWERRKAYTLAHPDSDLPGYITMTPLECVEQMTPKERAELRARIGG